MSEKAALASTPHSTSPSLQFMKWVSFIVLVVQSSGVIVITRYSRIVLPNEVYLSSTAVVMMELSKLLISLVGYYFETRSTFSLKGLYNDVAGPESDYLSMAVPASLYFVQNSLQFYATMYLDPATFQITNQGKILTTAILSVIWLKKVLSIQKWSSLLLITVIAFHHQEFILFRCRQNLGWNCDCSSTGIAAC